MTVLGGATGAGELSGFIGFFIQLETDEASDGRLRTESPRLGGLERLRTGLWFVVTIASKPFSPPWFSAKATHSEELLATTIVFSSLLNQCH